MATYRLDTNIIIDAINDKKNRNEVSGGSGRAPGPRSGHLPDQRGRGLRRHAAERSTAHHRAPRSLQLLPITFTVAALAGSLKYDYAKKGITLSLTDAIIAAVAIHNQLTLITEIIKHFP
jgi:predicted nucleic acid-binding protein